MNINIFKVPTLKTLKIFPKNPPQPTFDYKLIEIYFYLWLMKPLKLDQVILYVEDDEVDQMLFTKALQKCAPEYTLQICGNGEEGLAYLENEALPAPFIIVSDINMPKMNGIEFAKHIEQREHLRNKGIPFIFISTSNAGFDVDRAFELRVQGYFNKSHSIDKLNEDVQSIVNYWNRSMTPTHRT
jgi:CheY-like chemotaxis protein